MWKKLKRIAYLSRGTRWRGWSSHRATSWSVAGSIPVGVIGTFHSHNPSGRTMALGVDSASNRNDYQEYLLGAGAMTDKLTTFMCRLSRNLRASNWISNRPLQGLFDLYLAYLWMSVCTIVWRFQKYQVRNMAGTCAVLTAVLNPATCRGVSWITSQLLPFKSSPIGYLPCRMLRMQ